MFFTWTTEKKKPFPEMEKTVKATGLGGMLSSVWVLDNLIVKCNGDNN